MATIFTEGFDKYGSTGGNFNPTLQSLLLQEWTVVNPSNGNAVLVAGLSATGYALQINANNFGSGGFISKTLSSNYSRAIGGYRFNPAGLGTVRLMTFYDSGSPQCSITLSGAGAISLRTADINGTILATSTVTIGTASTHYLEWDITIAASGAYAVYLDGVSILSGTGNTRGGTSTSQYNAIAIQSITSVVTNFTIDDLYIFDTTTSFNNAVLLTNPRIETRYPNDDSQAQFTAAAITIMPTGSVQTSVSILTSSFFAFTGNVIELQKYTPAVNCTLQSVGLLPASSAGAKYKAVLYSDSSNAPNTLLATGTEVIGNVLNVVTTLPFASGQALTAGTVYWFGCIQDNTAQNFYFFDGLTRQQKANTYASGPPSPAGAGFSTGGSNAAMWGNATSPAKNFAGVIGSPPSGNIVGDNQSISSSTVNNEDLYLFPALSSTANLVYTIAVKGNARRPDSGARTFDLRLKSSGNDSAGSTSGFSPGGSYVWYSSYFDSNPNGSISWTSTTANAASAGPKIAS